jgi:hypothetical protein
VWYMLFCGDGAWCGGSGGGRLHTFGAAEGYSYFAHAACAGMPHQVLDTGPMAAGAGLGVVAVVAVGAPAAAPTAVGVAAAALLAASAGAGVAVAVAVAVVVAVVVGAAGTAVLA